MTTLTPQEAWEDFWNYINKPDRWAELKKEQRDELHQANRAASGAHRAALGVKRMARIFDTYAPGRYEVMVSVLLHSDRSR